MSANNKGWLASVLGRAGSTPSAIPPPSGRSVTPRTAARAVTSSGAGTVPPPPLGPVETPASPHSGRDAEFPRLVLAVDATASRAAAFGAAIRVTDRLFTVLPGELEVALAVHGGSRVHTFTRFTRDVGVLRDIAAGVTCQSGSTKLLDILDDVLAEKRVRVVLYIGDVFEELMPDLTRRAEALLLNATRVIVLHDNPRGYNDASAFNTVAAMTGGAVLPFDASAFDELAAMLEAVSVLAVGGPELLAEKQTAMPAAPLLLERLADSPQLLIGGSAKR